VLIRVPEVLSAHEVAECRRIIDGAEWVDGSETAGFQAARVKKNAQVKTGSDAMREAGKIVVKALLHNELFTSAAWPDKVYPPQFNRYAVGDGYGLHFDTAVIPVPGTPLRMRADLSATLFLSAPDGYDGGELVIEDTYGSHGVKLPAGDMILYPAGSLHKVLPVTRGARVGCFFWIQSAIADDSKRTMLFELGAAIDAIAPRLPNDEAVSRLTSVYQNLLRRWTTV
jgi:PKHD-type hydroxylase